MNIRHLIPVLALLSAGSSFAQLQDPTKGGDAPPAAAKAELKSRQSKITGLLVTILESQDMVGSASQMNATAIKAADPAAGMELKFNQEVGKEMSTALHEVEKFLSVRHESLPSGWTVEISFEEKFAPKDGPSAAVACALMVDSLVTGAAIDQSFACTGDMNADGSVQPVGGVPDKVEAAVRRKCALIAVPEKCTSMVQDYAILKGLRNVAAIQIFTVSDFDSARALAAAEKDAKVKTSMAAYQKISTSLAGPDALSVLKSAPTIASLKSILKDTPNCLSARLLLDVAEGKAARIMSPEGSFNALSRVGRVLMDMKAGNNGRTIVDKAMLDSLDKEIKTLESTRGRFDPRLRALTDAVLKFAKAFRQLGAMNPSSSGFSLFSKNRALQEAAAQVQEEEAKLRRNKSLMSELLD